MGDDESGISVSEESLLGYHSYSIGILTECHDLVPGPWQVGSLTGAVASQRVTEALKGSLRPVGNRSVCANAKGRSTARSTFRAGAKAGVSDPAARCGTAVA